MKNDKKNEEKYFYRETEENLGNENFILDLPNLWKSFFSSYFDFQMCILLVYQLFCVLFS